METMIWQLHYSLRCPNGHEFPIPRPMTSGIDGSLPGTTTVEKKAIIACPVCGHVSVYSSARIQATELPTPDPFQARQRLFVVVGVGCDGTDCVALKGVHTVLENDKGTWIAKVLPNNWKFSPEARCRNNHQLLWESPQLAYEVAKGDFWG